MKLLENKTAVVTGAAQGIGLATARTLGSSGATVILADRDPSSVESAAAELVAEGFDAHGICCDVTDEDAVAALVATALDRCGRIDVLVNNAGITRDSSMLKMSPADFRAVIDVSLFGAWLSTRAVASIMREQGSGAIVNMSSLSGKGGNPGQTNYSSAKAGLVGLTKASAKELASSGVRVNAVQPGLIRTPMTESMPESLWDQKIAEVPLRRAGEPAEVANAVLFLSSDLASYMTGTVLEVSGGRWM